MDETGVRQVFFSAHHPGGRSKPSVAGTALVKPLGFCMLPVMTGALVAMLQGYYALPYVTIGFAVAAACASAWTWVHIRSDVCEIHVHEGSVAVRSMLEAGVPTSSLDWKRVIDLESSPGHADVTLGLSSMRLDQEDWPEWIPMIEALGSAGRAWYD